MNAFLLSDGGSLFAAARTYETTRAPRRSSNGRAAKPASSTPNNSVIRAHTKAFGAAITLPVRRWCVCVPA